jgi:hypothetical protein
LRRHLEELGHGFKLNEIKEALDILSGTMIELSAAEEDQLESKKGKSANRRRNFIKATILSNYAGAFERGDSSGEKSHAAMTFQRTHSGRALREVDRSQGTIRKVQTCEQFTQDTRTASNLTPENLPLSMFRVVCGGFC